MSAHRLMSILQRTAHAALVGAGLLAMPAPALAGCNGCGLQMGMGLGGLVLGAITGSQRPREPMAEDAPDFRGRPMHTRNQPAEFEEVDVDNRAGPSRRSKTRRQEPRVTRSMAKKAPAAPVAAAAPVSKSRPVAAAAPAEPVASAKSSAASPATITASTATASAGALLP